MNRPFERVVAEHGETVLRVCRVVVGPVDADDAWSDTFLAALRAFPDLPEDANVQAWLVTIAHRKAIDIVRKRREDRLPLDDLIERPSPTASPARPRTTCGTPSGHCLSNNARPSPTTTWPAFPTPRSPASSAEQRRPPAAPPP